MAKKKTPITRKIAVTKKRSPTKSKHIQLHGPLTPKPDASIMWQEGFGRPLSIPDPYKAHAWVYACVRAIAQNLSQVPLRIQIGPEYDPKDITTQTPGKAGELARVFNKPNQFDTSAQLWERTAAINNIDGVAFWVLDREAAHEIPKRIMVFRKHHFIPARDGMNLLGWLFVTENGERIPLTVNQVLPFRFVDPDDPFMGLSPLEATRRGIRLDFLANDFSEDFFANGADPGGIISSEKRITKAQAKEIKDLWENRHKGSGRSHKIGVLYGGMTYEQMKISHKDMEFLGQRKWTRDEILAVFKVPKSEISLYEDLNFAAAKSQDKAFWQKTLMPILNIYTSVLQSHFVPALRPIVGMNLRFFFDMKTVPALQEDINSKIENLEKLTRVGVPLNVATRILELDIPRVAWGDTWYVNQAIVPVDMVLSQMVKGAKPSHPAVEAPSGADPKDPDTVMAESLMKDPDVIAATMNHENQGDPDKTDRQEEVGKSFDHERLDFYAKKMSNLLRGYMRRLRVHQLGILTRQENGTIALFDESTWNTKLNDRFSDLYKDLVDEIGGTFEQSYQYIETCFPSLNHRLRESIWENSLKKAKSIDEAMANTRKFFNKIVVDKELLLLSKMEIARLLKSLTPLEMVP